MTSVFKRNSENNPGLNGKLGFHFLPRGARQRCRPWFGGKNAAAPRRLPYGFSTMLELVALRRYVFSPVASRADGSRRSRRFSVARTQGLYGKATSQEIAIVKRPEGRAPSQILVGALNPCLRRLVLCLFGLHPVGFAAERGGVVAARQPLPC